jgi:integrase
MKTETSTKSLPGVEKRDNSIRISFTTRDGTRYRKTYKLDGIVMAPTGPNMKAAMRLVQEIKSEIKLGVFEMSRHFPEDATVLAAAAEAAATPAATQTPPLMATPNSAT